MKNRTTLNSAQTWGLLAVMLRFFDARWMQDFLAYRHFDKTAN